MDIATAHAATERRDILGRILDEVEGSAPLASVPPPEIPPAAPPGAPPGAPPAGPPMTLDGGGSPLAGLLSNPALLAALPTLLENVGPLLGGGPGRPSTAPPSAAIPPAGRPAGHHVDRHTALLCAVKPYLSAERQEAAETVIRLCRIWDTLERSGLSLTSLLASPAAPPPAPPTP